MAEDQTIDAPRPVSRFRPVRAKRALDSEYIPLGVRRLRVMLSGRGETKIGDITLGEIRNQIGRRPSLMPGRYFCRVSCAVNGAGFHMGRPDGRPDDFPNGHPDEFAGGGDDSITNRGTCAADHDAGAHRQPYPDEPEGHGRGWRRPGRGRQEGREARLRGHHEHSGTHATCGNCGAKHLTSRRSWRGSQRLGRRALIDASASQGRGPCQLWA
jgi:hypothetical protein